MLLVLVCSLVLVLFESGKTPGNDGISADFYIMFWSSIGKIWSSIGKILRDVFNHSFDAGQMSKAGNYLIN